MVLIEDHRQQKSDCDLSLEISIPVPRWGHSVLEPKLAKGFCFRREINEPRISKDPLDATEIQFQALWCIYAKLVSPEQPVNIDSLSCLAAVPKNPPSLYSGKLPVL